MATDTTRQIEATLDHHLRALFAKDVDTVVQHYTEESVMCTPQGPIRGLDQLRSFFTETISRLVTPELVNSFKMLRQDVEGEIAYIVWSAGSIIPMGTDTFVIRNGKIMVQTFAAHMPGRE